MDNVLVAYFSASGITEKVAKRISRFLDCETFKIEPLVSYTAKDLDWRDRESRSTKEMHDDSARPLIADKCNDMDKYDTIVLGFPIWWYKAPMIINTFLESYDFTGKNIVPFATSGGTIDLGDINNYLGKSMNAGTLKRGIIFNHTSNENIDKWINEEILGK